MSLRDWRPVPPPLPEDLDGSVTDGDPDWFARELAIAAHPPWWLWRFLLTTVSPAVSLFGRVQVTGGVPEHLRRGPLILAANHIGDYDTFTMAAALHRLGVVPRFLATGGIMRAPVAGPMLERAGGVRVDRGTDVAAHAMRVVLVALEHGGHVLVYPEGRVGLTADGWPERGRTGLARLALQTRVPVLPVSQWGAHEVLQYANDWGKLRTALRAGLAPARPEGARRRPGAPRRPGRRPGRRRPPGPHPHHGRHHPRSRAAAGRGARRPDRLPRPHAAGHGGRRVPRRTRPRRRPRCWTTPPPG